MTVTQLLAFVRSFRLEGWRVLPHDDPTRLEIGYVAWKPIKNEQGQTTHEACEYAMLPVRIFREPRQEVPQELLSFFGAQTPEDVYKALASAEGRYKLATGTLVEKTEG